MNNFFSVGVRYPIIAFLAAAVAYSLFLLMYHLSSYPDGAVLMTQSPALKLDFIRLKQREEKLDLNRRRPPDKPVLKKQPKLPHPPRERLEFPGTSQRPHLALPSAALNIRGGFKADLFGTRDLAPLVRVQPAYPIRAQHRGIEGWVEVEFAIDEDGRVIDPQVVDSEPAGVFDQATLKAITRWRYQPQVIDGNPVRRSGVRVVVEFKLRN